MNSVDYVLISNKFWPLCNAIYKGHILLFGKLRGNPTESANRISKQPHFKKLRHRSIIYLDARWSIST